MKWAIKDCLEMSRAESQGRNIWSEFKHKNVRSDSWLPHMGMHTLKSRIKIEEVTEALMGVVHAHMVTETSSQNS